MLPNLSFLSH